MPNPLIAQGKLNRLLASIVFPQFPTLNVTASYLGKEGISLAMDGNSTLYIPTMTGAVQSQEPYMQVTATIHLLKTQALAALFKAQIETDAGINDYTIYPDVPPNSGGLGPYTIINGAIQTVRDLALNGQDAGFVLTLGGFYDVNANLWG